MSLPDLESVRNGVVLLIDKPYTWTSFDVINKIRKQTHTKMGHAGTLDPLATGLLICCTGKKTKEITEYQKQDKEYTGIFQLGAVTPTFDLESQPEQLKSFDHINQKDIDRVLPTFTGAIQQMPPVHSAIKKDGQPVYKLARKGIAVKLEPRSVHIHLFEAQLKEEGEVHFKIQCSTGTYIRSMAQDLGQALGVGAYLKSLCRTKIGDFSLENANSVTELVAHFQQLSI